MTSLTFSLLLGGVLLNAVAQILLKAGTNALGALNFDTEFPLDVLLRLAFQPHILGGLICYVFSVSIWILALSKVPVSTAYPMLSIGYVVNAIIAWYALGEIMTLQKVIGIGIVIVGVYLIAKS